MLNRLESFFKKNIASLFHRGFSNELEPSELRNALENEIKERRKHTRNGYIVPNTYEIQLSTEDYQRLSSARFMEDMTVSIEKTLIQSNSFMDGVLSLRLREDNDFTKGTFAISSLYEDTKPTTVADTESNTLVLSHSDFTLPLNLPPVRRLASLRVVRGIDAKAYLEIGERKVYLGRREQNDLILTDLNVSRLHASIDYERHRHIIHDAGSLNGLFVNGERMSDACLLPGDEIGLGNTLLRYEVI
ncbi:MAG: DUF3662 domain-containing protein [Schwartzia sp.]|jgi:pSer/pThr/pTyr-binding forkhead associated (FHA) protein|nr:DUF3662 domain-containing protein [Schwartzia sp. (in: firmicutes)]